MKSEIQSSESKIAIVGAGPAGTSLAIRLAKAGFAVSLLEREKFPRQKLCGEFISPECLAHFRELGVLEEMLAVGGDRITETRFYAPNGKSIGVPSEWFGGQTAALSISRAEMDFRLLKKARAIGVEVLEETSAIGLLYRNAQVGGIRAKNKSGVIGEISADLTIDATGRANVLGKLAARQNAKSSKTKTRGRETKLVGFKTHLKNVDLPKGRCEIYFFRGGYSGLSHIENGLANHCFLIKADTVRQFSGQTNKMVKEVIFRNRRARDVLSNAMPVSEWLAVAVDGFGVKNLNPAKNLLAVGDAAAFIDPFTGSGMLMALESAEILAECVAENYLAPEKIAENYRALHQHKFSRRLRVCSLIRRAAFAPGLAGLAISALSFGDLPRRILAQLTRPALPVPKSD